MSSSNAPQLIDTPNKSLELEQAILGVCMLEQRWAPIVCNLITAEYFYYDHTRLIFETIYEMVSAFKNIDTLTVTENIVQKTGSRQFYSQNVSYLVSGCTKDVCGSLHVPDYCEALTGIFKGRKIDSIAGINSEGLTVYEKQEKITKMLESFRVTKKNNSWVGLKKVLSDYVDYYQNNFGRSIAGLKTGLKKLDWILNGLQPGELIIIAARTSIGKSVLGAQIAVNVARSGTKVAIITLEMTNSQLVGRIIAYTSQTPYTSISKFQAPVDFIIRSAESICELPIVFSEQTKASIEGIRSSFQMLIMQHDIGLLIIDYLQLMDSEQKTNTRNDEIGKITTGAKAMAVQNNIPVIAMAQINREGAKGEKPKLEHIRDSGNVEQDADKVIIIHGDRDMDERLLIIAKNRNGKLGQVPARFHGEHMEFIEIDTEKTEKSF